MALVELDPRYRNIDLGNGFGELQYAHDLHSDRVGLSYEDVNTKEAPNGYREESVRVPVDEDYLREIIGLGREDLLRIVPVGSFMTGSRVRLMAYFKKWKYSGDELREILESRYVFEPYDRMLGIRYSLNDNYLPEEIGASDLDIVTEVGNFSITSGILPSRTYPDQVHSRAVYEPIDGKKKDIHYHTYPPMRGVTDLRELHLRSEPTIFAFRLERDTDDNFYLVDPLNALGIGDEKSREGAHDWHFAGDEVNPEMLEWFKDYPPLFRFSLAVRASLNQIGELERYYDKKTLQTFRDGLDPEVLRAEYESKPSAKESFREYMRRALVTKIYYKERFLGALAEIGILDFVSSVMLEDLKPEENEIDRHVSWIFNNRAAFIKYFHERKMLWTHAMWEALKKGWEIPGQSEELR